MPIFWYKCPDPSDHFKQGFLGTAHTLMLQEPEPRRCPKCNRELIRAPQGSNTKVVEVVDNGLQSKRVEIIKK